MTARGFEGAEYRHRLARAQALMAEAGLDALLLTTEPEIRYFTGFLSRFWESPTRPWFLVVPAAGAPVAVIPSIGAALMGQSWIADIRTWRSPDPEDDGLSLLAATLSEQAGRRGRIGTPMGPETHLRMPLAGFEALKARLAPAEIVEDAGILRRLRLVKSEAEIAKIAEACAIAGRAFARVPEIAAAGTPLARVFQDFQRLALEEGADWVPYLAGAAAEGGYADVISPATDTPLAPGDVLMLDTGAVWDGYFCDFDRNFSVGPPAPAIAAAHARLVEATEAAFAIARPGATAADLFHAMHAVAGGGAAAEAGRLGHGLGMQLTEWPSLIPGDHTPLVPGMVLTLEPSIEVAPSAQRGCLLVHEEDIVIRETGAEYLTRPADPVLPFLETRR
ncbi:MAG: Xaa-Pro peptidase family protein [Pseudomonadota bacterium]